MRPLVHSLLAGAIVLTSVARQTQQLPTLIFDSPVEEGALLISIVKISVRIDPSTIQATRVDFFVDGRNVCTRTAPPFECPFDMGPTPKAHLISAAAMTSAGTLLRASVRTAEIAVNVSENRASVSRVPVPVVVTDTKGHAILNLSRESFKLFVDNVEQQVDIVVGQNPDTQVVVALNVSASMSSSMDALKKGVVDLASRLRNADQLTLLAFNNETFRVGQSVTDHQALASLLDRVKPTGGTALYDMLAKAVDEFKQAVGVSRALVVFTDGADTGSFASAGAVERYLLTRDITFYFVTRTIGRKSAEGQRLIQTLTTRTGGLWSEIASLKELGATLADIVEDIKHQYLLSFEPTSPPDGREHAIRVDVVGRGNVRVRARQNFIARTPGA